jgi:hypothetical protein
MENISKSLTLGLKIHQVKAEELKTFPWIDHHFLWIDRRKLGLIATLDRSPAAWIDRH